MQIEKVDSTLNGDPIKCGHFNSSMYDSYIEFPVNLDTGKKYTIHGYIKSSVAGQISCEGVTSNVSIEWSHVVMTITPSQQKSLELKFYPGEFWIYEWKLEVGEVNSNWTPSPLDAKYDLISLGSEVKQLSDSITQKVWKEDINNATKEINKSMTTIGQNAEKIYWLIDKNSENQASMSLTSDLYKLVAENINLAGKVTFESFSSSMQENWNGLSNTVNNSINKVTTEYYKSTSSEEPLDGKWSEASPLWEEGYYIWSRTVSTNLNGDNEVSEPVCITGNKGSDGVGISSIISQYYLSSSSTELKDGSWIDNESPTWVKEKYIWTRSKITWNNGNVTTTTAVLAKALNTANENAVAAWNTTQDIIKNIYVTNKTTIDGGRIETGTVTADAIATDAIVSKNYVKDCAGSFLNLADGTFDSKYLKWDETGAITATSGNIGGFTIDDSGLHAIPVNTTQDVAFEIFNITGFLSDYDDPNTSARMQTLIRFAYDGQERLRYTTDGTFKIGSSQLNDGVLNVNGNINFKQMYAPVSYDKLNQRATTSSTDTDSFKYTWTINGTGLFILDASVWTDTTTDYGTTSCAIYVDGVCVAANRHRYGEDSINVELDAGTTFVYWFRYARNKQITLQAGSSKSGTKTLTYTVQGLFGLTVA